MIAAPLQPAEGEPPARADRRSIPFDDAAIELRKAAFESGAARGVNARRQAVVGRVGDRHGLLRAGGVVDGEVGTEQLLAFVRRAGPLADTVHARCRVAAAQATRGKRSRSEHRLGRGLHAREELLQGHFGGEGAHEHAIPQRMPDREPLRHRRDAGGDRVGALRRTFDDQPARRRAPLPRRDERGEHRVVDRLVHVGVAQDDRRVLPAHLQREQLGLPMTRAFDGLSDAPTPGEEHRIDVGVRRERGADRTRPLHEVDDSRGSSGLHEATHIQLGRLRSDLARLEHDGVAAGKRRQHVSVGEVHGKVERSEHGRDPERAEAALGVRLPGGREVFDELHPVFDRDGRLGGARLQFGARFPEWLSHFQRDRSRKFLLAAREHFADAAHEPGSLLDRSRRPSRLRCPSRFDGSVDLPDRPTVPPQHDRQVGRRTILDHPVRTRRLGKGASHEIHACRITPQIRRLHRKAAMEAAAVYRCAPCGRAGRSRQCPACSSRQ